MLLYIPGLKDLTKFWQRALMMEPGQSKSRHQGQPGPEVSQVLLAELWEAAGGKRHAHRPKHRAAP